MVQLAFLFVLIRFLFYPIIQRPGRVRDRVGQGAAGGRKEVECFQLFKLFLLFFQIDLMAEN